MKKITASKLFLLFLLNLAGECVFLWPWDSYRYFSAAERHVFFERFFFALVISSFCFQAMLGWVYRLFKKDKAFGLLIKVVLCFIIYLISLLYLFVAHGIVYQT
jgi:hypothetical protein